jgi:hypothetical protein
LAKRLLLVRASVSGEADDAARRLRGAEPVSAAPQHGGERGLDVVACAGLGQADRAAGVGERRREFREAHHHLRRLLIVRAAESQ